MEILWIKFHSRKINNVELLKYKTILVLNWLTKILMYFSNPVVEEPIVA